MIRIQSEDFSLATESEGLKRAGHSGALVCFVGLVRDFEGSGQFYLQHYPGMTESVLEKLEQKAHKRWPLLATTIIHRVGKLNVDEQIVFVGVSAIHRKDAFAACEYLIDALKTEAPFWKKEGEHWVEAKKEDQDRADRWLCE